MRLLSYSVYTTTLALFLACQSPTDGKTPVAQTTAQPPTGNTGAPAPLPLVNGTTAANQGDKSGVMKLTVFMDNDSGARYMALYEVESKFNHPLDSVPIVGGRAQFAPRQYHRGFYTLALNGEEKNMQPIIMNPDEEEVVVGFKTFRLESGFYCKKSKENEGLAEYYPHDSKAVRQLLELKRARTKSDNKEHYNQEIQRQENTLHQLQQQLIFKYPDTFLAKWLTWKQNPNKHDRAHYWEHIDFADPTLVRTRILHEKSQEYMQLFGGSSEAGFIQCIDEIVALAKANPTVLETTLYNLLDGFSQTKYDGVCRYLLDNYIYGDGCGAEMSDVLKNRARGIRNVQVGNVPPNIKLPLLAGGQSDLYNLAAKNKYTMVLFWSSWCKYCAEESPAIKALYEQFHTKGFEILGVSLDAEPSLWKKAVQERGFTFPNVMDVGQYQSPTARNYFVVRTPVMLVLDQKGTIVFRAGESISEVKQFLEQNLR